MASFFAGKSLVSDKGSFLRPDSIFRRWIEPISNPNAVFPAAKDRYHLYISYACPWATRCLATLYLKKLDEFIGVSVVHPVFQRTRPNDPQDKHAGWAFLDPKKTPTLPGPTGLGSYSSEGATLDTINHCNFVRDLYEMCYKGEVRYTVPILWDKKTKTIINNESADIVRMFNSAFDSFVLSPTIDLYPNKLQNQIDEINAWVYDGINNGVYKCGFAQSQQAYDEAVETLFASLDKAEDILTSQRYLCGRCFTEADLRLFMTLVRFDEVYVVHFKTNKKMIEDYPNLRNYLREIYQMPEVKRAINMQHIKLHYYASHTHINTFGIVPIGPNYDYNTKHDRNRLSAAPTK
ncbi:unnamed protein product [Albugo candida]|uniref:GST C-terminal domain-containing protein n=1 Tax=Albugo candida TaxID=65357 RepID=A0A024FZE8_9STRA|nr:unnamed protein product [Albugo candida]|eukprot:CCI39698.1 unnamed protein product [Albugo candida]